MRPVLAVLIAVAGAVVAHWWALDVPPSEGPAGFASRCAANVDTNAAPQSIAQDWTSGAPVREAAESESIESLPPPLPCSAASSSDDVVRLRVLDEATGEDLSDVRVLGIPPRAAADTAGKVVVEHATSPLEFAPVASSFYSRYVVEVPQRVCGFFFHTAKDTRVHEMRLARSADVEIEFAGVRPPPGTSLRIWREPRGRERVMLDIEFEGDVPPMGNVRVEALPAVPLVFTVEKGEPWNEPFVAGRTDVTLVPGDRNHVVIRCEAVVEPPLVRVVGTLTISPAWNCNAMWFEPRGAGRPWHPENVRLLLTSMQRVSDSEYRWDAGTLPVGWYRVGFGNPAFWTRIEVGPVDGVEHRIAVPDPCEMRVRVVDAATGQPLAVEASVAEGVPLPDDVGCMELLHDMAKQGDGSLRAVVVPGRIRLLARAEGYLDRNEMVDVRPDSGEFVLRMCRFGVRVGLSDAGSHVYWQRGWTARVLDAEGWSVSGSELQFARPGTYRVTVDGVTDHDFEPTFVTLANEGWTNVAIPARRR